MSIHEIGDIDEITGRAFDLVAMELEAAMKEFGAMASAHEGYAVILEELDEAWDEIKANDPEKTLKEIIQVAAMAIRFMVDVSAKINPDLVILGDTK